MFIGAVVQPKLVNEDKVKKAPNQIEEKTAKSKVLSLKPTSELLKPTSEFLKPTSELLKPTSEFVKPVSELLKPTFELLKPTSEFLKPTSELYDGFPKQPAVNLTNLMVLALIEADSKGLSIVCKDAYKFVNKRFPFYDVKNPECSNSWKNSVRHTLNVVLADRKILTRRAPPKLETDCNCLGQCTHETGGKTIYSYGMY